MKTTTVKELIRQLQFCPEDAIVQCYWGSYGITGVKHITIPTEDNPTGTVFLDNGDSFD